MAVTQWFQASGRHETARFHAITIRRHGASPCSVFRRRLWRSLCRCWRRSRWNRARGLSHGFLGASPLVGPRTRVSHSMAATPRQVGVATRG